MDDGVEHAVFEEEFAALEALREFLPDGLLDDAGSGETDEGSRLGDIQVAQHGERCGDAARRGIGEDRNVGHLKFVKAGEGGGDFGQLHKADNAFHHAGAAGGGDDD